MKITVSIPYYNRSNLIMETIKPLVEQDSVDEILICDDCSKQEDFDRLLRKTEGIEKIRIVRNIENVHTLQNKHNCVFFAKNEWVLLLDSDNVVEYDYFKTLLKIKYFETDTIYHTSFAAPTFDYRQFNDETITKKNVKNFVHHPIFMTLLNTVNFFVNRDEFLKNYKYDSSIRAADGIFLTHNWLKNGNKIYIVPDLKYYHRVHEGSEFLRERDNNMKLINYWMNQVKLLKI
jgi:glycosyltransferase involved in cell wall biosynthesis